MANDQGFVDFVLDQIHDDASFKHMFGGTTLYLNGKVVALICDDQLFVKPTEPGRSYIGDVAEAPAYEGAKPSFLVTDRIEDAEWLTELLQITERALPAKKPRKKKASR